VQLFIAQDDTTDMYSSGYHTGQSRKGEKLCQTPVAAKKMADQPDLFFAVEQSIVG